MGAYITDDKGNIVYPRTLAKCVKKGGTTLDDYLDKVEDNLLIKPTTQGTDIQLQDASDMNIQELHVYGRTEQASTVGSNLFNVNDTIDKSIFTVDDEGYITATINPNNTDGNKYYNFYTRKSDLLKTDTEYLIVTEILKMPTEKCQLNITSLEENSKGQFANIVTKTIKGIKFDKVKTRNDMSGCVSMMRGFMFTQPGFTGGKIKFRISVLEDTSITSDTFKYEPYTGGIASPNPDYPQGMNCVENPKVNLLGKNLFKTEKINLNAYNGIDKVVNDDNSITLNGTATDTIDIYFMGIYDNKKALILNENKVYKIKIFGNIEGKVTLFTGERNNIISSKSELTIKNRSYLSFIMIRIEKGTVFNNETVYVQLEAGDTATEYEQYKPLQTATLNYELNGIDDVKDELVVKSDGTGQLIQKWKRRIIDDSVSFYIDINPKHEVGVLINLLAYRDAINTRSNLYSLIYSDKLTAIKNIYDEDVVGIGYTSTSDYVRLRLPVSIGTTDEEIKNYLEQNPIEILYLLKEPIVTELSSEEIQEVLALHTNKPNTTIWNDQNAEMQVTYVADAKNYIDNKFTELENSVCGGLLITDNLIDNSNMLNNTALTISDKISTSSNSTYKTYLNIPVKAGESYYIGKSHRNSCIIDSIENKKVLQSNMVNQTDSYIFNVNYDGFLCVCFYTTEQNPKIALLTREKTES